MSAVEEAALGVERLEIARISRPASATCSPRSAKSADGIDGASATAVIRRPPAGGARRVAEIKRLRRNHSAPLRRIGRPHCSPIARKRCCSSRSRCLSVQAAPKNRRIAGNGAVHQGRGAEVVHAAPQKYPPNCPGRCCRHHGQSAEVCTPPPWPVEPPSVLSLASISVSVLPARRRSTKGVGSAARCATALSATSLLAAVMASMNVQLAPSTLMVAARVGAWPRARRRR